MDTSVLVSIVVAVIAIVPGIFALVNQASKGKLEERFDMLRTVQDATHTELTRLQMKTTSLEDEKNVEKLYKKMYEKPVIIRCDHCKSANVITNLECIKCGAPIGVNDA
jgi:hypothetical protein